jgi:hypothetical protein
LSGFFDIVSTNNGIPSFRLGKIVGHSKTNEMVMNAIPNTVQVKM